MLPTAYGGTHVDNEWLIGEGRTLDPARWFDVSPDIFAAGLSTSPSRAHPSQARAAFPYVSPYDNVAAQHRLAAGVGADAADSAFVAARVGALLAMPA